MNSAAGAETSELVAAASGSLRQGLCPSKTAQPSRTLESPDSQTPTGHQEPMQTLDETKLDAFHMKMIGILNGGTLSVMTSIGHRTGLFDTMANMSGATSANIAKAAGLDERYVREWLGRHGPIPELFA